MAEKGLGAQLEGLSGLPVSRQISLMIVIAAAIALSVVVMSWMGQPAWQTLYTPQTDREASELVAALSRANIAYQMEPGSGAIQVPADQHATARQAMAGQGVGGGDRGFEMMDQQGYGTSQALENARLQRAMEGELQRSINAMAGISSSRVHLAIPRSSPFAKRRQQPTASVLLRPLPGYQIDEVVAGSISRLIAASVPEMTPARVTVLDHRGRLLSGSKGNNALAMSDGQLSYTQRVEDQLARRIESILIPVVGLDGVRAQVHAQLDFTEVDEAAEQYDPERRTVRSEQSQSQQSGAGSLVGGIPGALSNSPPGSEVVATPLEEGGNSQRSSVVNYEINRTVRHTRNASGAIKRLSVAVLVNYIAVADGDPAPMEESQLARIEALIKEAVGLDQARGDTLSLTNMEFLQPETAEVVEVPIWEQGWVPGVIKQSLGVLMLLVLVFMVLRPISKRLSEMPPPQQLAQAVPEPEMLAAASAAQHALPAAEVEQLEMVRNLADTDPKKVSQVVKEWIESDA
ncbi:MAG: flagellar M-ring protein FliF [Immundisolibacteraceae bacterium]|nr:flagellar M-ring protein FliF [Immundisolibacteraceae bacterium]